MFMIDPETGRKVLATRRRRGGGCHGKGNLFWKSHGDGWQVLICRVCNKEHGQRLVCFRCDRIKEDFECGRCAAHRAGGAEIKAIEEGGELACSEAGGLCCKCAGINPVEGEE